MGDVRHRIGTGDPGDHKTTAAPVPTGSVRLSSVRPLVRYVDESQAVVEVHFTFEKCRGDVPEGATIDVLIELRGEDGSIDEHRRTIPATGGAGFVKLAIVEPMLWWPAGLGKQPLYTVAVTLLEDDEPIDHHEASVGLTSVRCKAPMLQRQFLVNGREVAIGSIVPVDQADERHLLPAAGDSLLLVRGHYGPDVLYHAADRAGILLLQCVPIHPLAKPTSDIAPQVDRLAGHPSLAGWFVGHLGPLADDVATALQKLDPTHGIYRAVA